MKPNVFPVQRSVVRGDALIEQILVHYDLPAPITCHLFSPVNDDIYQVSARDEHFMLRIYSHGKFSQAEVEAEAQILDHLEQNGLPVVRPIPSTTGRFVYEINAPEGERYCILYAHVDGTSPRADIQPEQSAVYGQAVARLHNALDGFSQPIARCQIDYAYLLETPLALVEPFLKARPDDWHYLCEVATYLRTEAPALPNRSPAYGLCHGDLHKANLLMVPDGQLTIIDWDCMGYGWRAYDVAVLRWSIGPAVGPEGIGEPRLSQVWHSYLENYERLRPLSDVEHASIPYFVAMRHIRVLGWEIGNCLAGRWGLGILTDGYWDDRILRLRGWMEEHCGYPSVSRRSYSPGG